MLIPILSYHSKVVAIIQLVALFLVGAIFCVSATILLIVYLKEPKPLEQNNIDDCYEKYCYVSLDADVVDCVPVQSNEGYSKLYIVRATGLNETEGALLCVCSQIKDEAYFDEQQKKENESIQICGFLYSNPDRTVVINRLKDKGYEDADIELSDYYISCRDNDKLYISVFLYVMGLPIISLGFVFIGIEHKKNMN